jgi:hypothetical protein
VFAVVDGKTFYQGPRGGVYYWKTKADGTRAKVYVKKTTAAK